MLSNGEGLWNADSFAGEQYEWLLLLSGKRVSEKKWLGNT